MWPNPQEILKKSAMENFIFSAVEYLIITWLFSYLVRVGNFRGGSRAAATSKMECFVIIAVKKAWGQQLY